MAISTEARLRQNKKAWAARKTLDRMDPVWWNAIRERFNSPLRERFGRYIVRIIHGFRRSKS